MTRKCIVHGRTTNAVLVFTASTVRSATISGFRGGNSLGNLKDEFIELWTTLILTMFISTSSALPNSHALEHLCVSMEGKHRGAAHSWTVQQA